MHFVTKRYKKNAHVVQHAHFLGLKAYKLKFVTYAQTDTGTVNIIAESGS